MAPRRKLADLYLVGKEVTFDDGQGEPVVVYVRKLTAADREIALRRSNAARARILAARSDPGSEEYLSITELSYQMSRDELLDYLVEDERYARTAPIEAELAAEEPWSKDSYLEGLRDAWTDGLDDAYARDNQDPEAVRVFDELKRFADAVDSAVAARLDDFRRSLDERPDETLRGQVAEKMIELHASRAWLNEFRRCEVWLSVREQDKKTRVLKERGDVDELPEEVLDGLVRAYREISVDPSEGKRLGGDPHFVRLVRSTRNAGNGQFLRPSDCTCIEDTPFELLDAIDHAHRICDWHENLSNEEVPPAWMWPFEDELDAWFEQVEESRRTKYGLPLKEAAQVPMIQNEMAKGRGR